MMRKTQELQLCALCNLPSQIVPLFGHSFKQRLDSGDAVVVLDRSLQVLLSLGLQLVGLVTELQPRVAQAAEFGMFWGVLATG